MPAALPSKSRVENVLLGIEASGHAPAGVHVSPDGSFFVSIESTNDSLDCVGDRKLGHSISTWDEVS